MVTVTEALTQRISIRQFQARPVPQETDTSERVRLMHAGAQLGWSDGGGMVEQQASAGKWVEAASEARANVDRLRESSAAIGNVVDLMAALKKSMEAKGRTKVRDAVRKRIAKQPEEEARPTPARSRPSRRVARRTTSP